MVKLYISKAKIKKIIFYSFAGSYRSLFDMILLVTLQKMTLCHFKSSLAPFYKLHVIHEAPFYCKHFSLAIMVKLYTLSSLFSRPFY